MVSRISRVRSLFMRMFSSIHLRSRYPGRSDCPDTGRAVNPEVEDEPWYSHPYSQDNWFFPDFNHNTCSYGRDYPTWMGHDSYEKHYLFSEGNDCCSKYFPTVSDCPNENAKQQTGYYWTSYEDSISNTDPMPIIFNYTYYPDLASSTCING